MKRSFSLPTRRGPSQHFPAGFSLVELLVVILFLAVLAAVAVPGLVGVRTAAAESKLRSDVNHLNHAIDAYTAEGGRLDDVTTAAQVIAKLKTKLGTLAARRHVGPVTGRLVDPRLAIRPMTNVEARSTSLRVAWNASLKRFELSRQGAGIASFYFDDAMAGSSAPEEERDRTSMLFNRADGWIWEWSEQGPSAPTAPAEFALAPSPDLVPPSEGGGSGSDSSDSTSSFAPTTVSGTVEDSSSSSSSSFQQTKR